MLFEIQRRFLGCFQLLLFDDQNPYHTTTQGCNSLTIKRGLTSSSSVFSIILRSNSEEYFLVCSNSTVQYSTEAGWGWQ
jgi:hypothetical protein